MMAIEDSKMRDRILMEHDPLGDGHNGFLCLIECGQLCLDCVICVRHVCDEISSSLTVRNVYLILEVLAHLMVLSFDKLDYSALPM